MTTDTISPAAAAAANSGISYEGRAGRLFGLGLKVAALTLLTLGFYRFWGKTEIRRYLWSRVRLDADRFEYTGTGKELFLGFLIVLAVLIPLGIVFQTLAVFSVAWSPAAQAWVSSLQTVVFLYLIGYAIYRARRYRLSRTLLRGIRFGQAGSAVRYGLMFLGYMLLAVVTLGIAKPVGDVALYRFQTNNTQFGDHGFEFDGKARDMMGRWLLCWVLTPFTLGLSLVWYAAYKIRYFADSTRFGDTTFALPIKLWDLIRLYAPYYLLMGALAALAALYVHYLDPNFGSAGNVMTIVSDFLVPLIAGLTIAILAPALQLVMITHRFAGMIAQLFDIFGTANFESIIQGAQQKSGAAEGMADALDIGAGVEIGF